LKEQDCFESLRSLRSFEVSQENRRNHEGLEIKMNLYAHDLSLSDFNLNFSDPILQPFSHRRTSSSSNSTTAPCEDDDFVDNNGGDRRAMANRSPPKHRHDGKSPLPLGMDWSPPPRKWVLFLFVIDPQFFFFFLKKIVFLWG
jgi:hypothetical protein